MQSLHLSPLERQPCNICRFTHNEIIFAVLQSEVSNHERMALLSMFESINDTMEHTHKVHWIEYHNFKTPFLFAMDAWTFESKLQRTEGVPSG